MPPEQPNSSPDLSKILVGIVAVLIILIAGMAGYYLYTSGALKGLKLASPFDKAVQEEGGTSLQVAMDAELKRLPEGWTEIFCGGRYYHLNPPGAPEVACETAKPASVAITVYTHTQDVYKDMLTKGAKITKEGIKVGGKDALVVEKDYLATVVLTGETQAFYVVLNNRSKYRKEYDEIVSKVSFFAAEEIKGVLPEPENVQPEAAPTGTGQE